MKAPCANYVEKKVKVCNTSEYEKFAQKEYKRRHDNVAKKVHWHLCNKNGLEHTEEWYKHFQQYSSRKWKSECVVGFQCLVWQRDRSKKTRHNFNWQEGVKGDNHRYCCTSWCKSRGNRKGETGKVPGVKKSDWKIAQTKNGRSSACSSRSP